jgi:hypothetical protein
MLRKKSSKNIRILSVVKYETFSTFTTRINKRVLPAPKLNTKQLEGGRLITLMNKLYTNKAYILKGTNK